MTEWFDQLAPRERLVLVVGSVLAIIIVGWNFVWSPLRDRTSELDAAVAVRAREVVDLKRAANLSPASPQSGPAIDAPSLTVLIDETGRAMGLASAVTRSNQDGPDVINVSFRNARFDRLMTWLIDLEQRYGLAVVSAGISQAAGSGLVDGQVRLDRS